MNSSLQRTIQSGKTVFRKTTKRLADIQARIILSVVYWLILCIPALSRKKQLQKRSQWVAWDQKNDTLEEVRRQY